MANQQYRSHTTPNLDTEGILIGYATHDENAGTQIFLNLDDSKYRSKHLAIFGSSGSGMD